MKGLLAYSVFVVLSTGALANEPPPEDTNINSKMLIGSCAQLAIVAKDIIGGAEDISENDSMLLAFLLSDSFPQAYNAVYTGLKSAHELSKLQFTGSATEQAEVLGLWCTLDTVNEINKLSSPYLFEQEIQVELLDIFERVLTTDIP